MYVLSALCALIWLCALLRCRAERALPLLIPLYMLVTLPLAMARALWVMDTVSVSLIIVTVIAAALFRKRLRDTARLVFTPGLAAFCALAALMYFSSRSRAVWEWDEYSYWALKVKELWFFSGLNDGARTLTPRFGDYMPGAQLTQWLFMRALGRWSEGTLYFSMITINMAYLAPLMERVTWRRAYLTLPALLAALALPAALSSSAYVSVGVDTLMGMQMGYLLFTLWELKKRASRGLSVSAALTLCALTLTKRVGLLWGLAALAFYIVAVDGDKRREAFRLALRIASAPALCFLIWSAFCAAYGLTNYLSEYGARALATLRGPEWFLPLGFKTFLLGTLKTFFISPVSGSSFVTDMQPPIGPSIFACMLVFCAVPLVSRRMPKRLAVFWAVVTALFMLSFCLSFLTSLRHEIQLHADDPKRIPASLIRYCCPLVLGLGSFYALLLPGVMSGLDGKRAAALALAACAVTAPCVNYLRLSTFLIPPVYIGSYPTIDAAKRFHVGNQWLSDIKDPKDARVLMSGCGYYQHYAYAMAPASAVEMYDEDWTGGGDEADLWRFVRENAVTHVMLYGDWGRVNPTARKIIARGGSTPRTGRLYRILPDTSQIVPAE